MKCRLIAAGTRLPEWVNSGISRIPEALRAPLVLELQEIPVATRRAGENPQRAVAARGRGHARGAGPG
jgi:23S rRNA pseudoU1915 N3-methylase RlmH